MVENFAVEHFPIFGVPLDKRCRSVTFYTRFVQVSTCDYLILSGNWEKNAKQQKYRFYIRPKINYCYLEYSHCECDRDILKNKAFLIKNEEPQPDSILALAKFMSGGQPRCSSHSIFFWFQFTNTTSQSYRLLIDRGRC